MEDFLLINDIYDDMYQDLNKITEYYMLIGINSYGFDKETYNKVE